MNFWNSSDSLLGQASKYKEGKVYIMAKARKKIEETALYAKRFVRYDEGALKYSMGLCKFQILAKEAKAIYKVDKIVLVNCDVFEKYLETFREF